MKRIKFPIYTWLIVTFLITTILMSFESRDPDIKVCIYSCCIYLVIKKQYNEIMSFSKANKTICILFEILAIIGLLYFIIFVFRKSPESMVDIGRYVNHVYGGVEDIELAKMIKEYEIKANIHRIYQIAINLSVSIWLIIQNKKCKSN